MDVELEFRDYGDEEGEDMEEEGEEEEIDDDGDQPPQDDEELFDEQQQPQDAPPQRPGMHDLFGQLLLRHGSGENELPDFENFLNQAIWGGRPAWNQEADWLWVAGGP